jgi:uncharacterized membrane protein YkoI
LLAAFVLIPVAASAETKVSLESLPQAVQTAIKKAVGTAPISSICQENENGKIEYEVETTYDGKLRSYEFNAKGSLLEIEDAIDLDSLPAAAKSTIQNEAAGGSIKEVEKVTKHGKVSYESEITTSAGKKLEIAVTSASAIESVENKDEEKDEAR